METSAQIILKKYKAATGFFTTLGGSSFPHMTRTGDFENAINELGKINEDHDGPAQVKIAEIILVEYKKLMTQTLQSISQATLKIK